VSTVNGNANLSKVTTNALSVLEAIGQPSVSVFPGSARPFCRTVHVSDDIHGASGLAGTDLLPVPKRNALAHCNAIKEMRDALLSCPRNTAWLIATGPLTNVALLFAIYPEAASHVSSSTMDL
jgi:uridine nucleosidase